MPIIKSIELRNYILQPGMHGQFTEFMNEIIVPRQEQLGGYMLAEYKLKGADDNFFWIRGFADMNARSKFLKDFYYSDYWKQHRNKTNSMLVDSYDVHLLKPLTIKGQSIDTTIGVNANELKRRTGITAINYYVTNNKRDKLIDVFVSRYLPALKNSGITSITLWISETAKNDYAPQHVFQDHNLLVTIAHYNDEAEYKEKMKLVSTTVDESTKKEMKSLATLTTQILYPALPGN